MGGSYARSMPLRSLYRRLRDRLVLGHVRPLLHADEPVLDWAHVHDPVDDRPGVAAVTPQRVFVQWSDARSPDAVLRWDEVAAWDVRRSTDTAPVLTLEAAEQRVVVCLPVSSRVRARAATRLLRRVMDLAPPDADGPPGFVRGGDQQVEAARRGFRGHVRRVVLTVVGMLLILLGGLFATPFVPGPGALTVLAGLAILAREYEWAKDIYLWFRRMVDRVIGWYRRRRAQRRARRHRDRGADEPAVPGA